MLEDIYNCHGYTVTVRSCDIWFTVYDADGRIVGTIERPHYGCATWRAYATDATILGIAAGPRSALRKFTRLARILGVPA